MHRATLIYLSMTLILIAGLWLILTAGTRLQAPPDFAGRWELLPHEEGHALPALMLVEQSGRYFRIHINGERVYSMRLKDQRWDEALEPPRLAVELTGGGATARFEGPISRRLFDFHLHDGTTERSWTALWVQRTYPRGQESEPPPRRADAAG